MLVTRSQVLYAPGCQVGAPSASGGTVGFITEMHTEDMTFVVSAGMRMYLMTLETMQTSRWDKTVKLN